MSKILVIEDDICTRAMLKVFLEKAGHEIEEAVDGIEGLLKVQQERPDLIILDVRMPKMDGWEVCSQLKGKPKTAKIPILMLTSLNEQSDADKGYVMGADAYLAKPWEPKRVLEVMTRLLKPPTRSSPPKS